MLTWFEYEKHTLITLKLHWFEFGNSDDVTNFSLQREYEVDKTR